MRAFFSLIVATGLFAQEPPSVPATRGALIEWEGAPESGDISIRTATFHVYRFRFDDRTRFEFNGREFSISDARKGDVLEVVSDLGPGVSRSYAQQVHVVRRGPPPPPPAPVITRRSRIRAHRPYRDELFQRGNLTFAGVILSLSDDRFLVRTRSDGEKTVLLRPDTRYLEGGAPVGLSDLRVNTRVFVRAGKNFSQEIEAFQVVWGEILLLK